MTVAANAVVYMWNKIISKLFPFLSTCVWNNFISVRETFPELFQNYFRGLLQLMNIFQNVQCREIITR